MIKFSDKITKNITDLDTVYADVLSKMSIEERITYCEILIKTTEDFLMKNELFLHKTIKIKSLEIISAAQIEVKELKKQIKRIKKN
ncbi:MAG: hypothetical protein H0W73_06015 [Bacteroidetes bacterium]|nr:hypothetical protein [Bacteroidota bacterium]